MEEEVVTCTHVIGSQILKQSLPSHNFYYQVGFGPVGT